MVREKKRLACQTDYDLAVTAYYDSMSDLESAEQNAWGQFTTTEFWKTKIDFEMPTVGGTGQ